MQTKRVILAKIAKIYDPLGFELTRAFLRCIGSSCEEILDYSQTGTGFRPHGGKLCVQCY